MRRVAFYSGSFDPMTNGHLDVMTHAAGLCDKLVVGVGAHPSKSPLFTVEERLALIREAAAEALASQGCELEAISFDGLAVEAIEQVADRRLRRRPFEFGIVGGLEVFPSRRIAMVAPAQRVARRDLL